MRLSRETLSEMVHFAEAVEILEAGGRISEEQAREITSFALRPAAYKSQLVGIPFLIIEAEILPGKDHTRFAQLIIIDVDDHKCTIRDSSRGIFEQVTELVEQSDTPILHGLFVRKGLRFEEYPFVHPATKIESLTRTYYLDF